MALPEARAQQERYFATLNRAIPAVASVYDVAVPSPLGVVAVRIVKPTVAGPLPCIVFVRGAGFWAGSLDSHANTVHTLANLSGCAVCVIDYRRTPEFTYPAQRDELLSVLRWLHDEGAELGLRSHEPVLFGESAGATICLSAALALRDARAPLPAGMILFYNNAGGPKPTSRPYSRWVWEQYLGESDPWLVPGAIPLLEDLRGLPPMWLACGEDDPLLDDTLCLAERLSSSRVPHSVVLFPGMPHAFLMFTATLRPALDALSQAAQAARTFFDRSPRKEELP